MTESNPPLSAEEQEANRLYWSSSDSVNEVASRLGLSKGGLYELLRPYPSGSACPECGAELGFQNRTARDRNRLSCDDCGLELENGVELEPVELPALPPGAGRRPLTDDERKRVRILAGGALLGIAAGLLIGWRLRR
jgi:lysine biosynthesis protein LysW